MNVYVVDTGSGRRRTALPADEFLDLREQSTVFEDVIGTRGDGMVLTTADSAEFVRVVHVTPNFFGAMGLPPLIGRSIGPADGAADSPPVAVLRHRAWVSYFGGDPGVVGRVIRLNGESRTVVGVMPPRFTWHAADIWIPGAVRRGAADAPDAPRSFQARLKPGVTPQQAEAELSLIVARRAREHPDEYPGTFRVAVVNVIAHVVGDFRAVLYTALAAVALLLLIACCNVANMLLARATVREREMTVRAALGASRSRLVRQLLIESLLLALCGGVSGCVVAYAGIKLLVRFLPEGPLPGEVEFGLDAPALVFSLAVAIGSAVLFGAAPALYSVRRNLVDGLRGDSRSVSGRGGLRHALVAAEIALSLVLLLSAGLLMRSFMSLIQVDLGFDGRNVLVYSPAFAPDTQARPEVKHRFYEQVVERLASLPGVEGAAVTTALPPFNAGFASAIEIPGRPQNDQPTVSVQFCTDQYFRTLGIRFLRGREWPASASQDADTRAIVSQSFAAAYFGGEDPVGRLVAVAVPSVGSGTRERRVFEILGVVEDVRNQGLREALVPQVYLRGGTTVGTPELVVRTSLDPRHSRNAIREEIRTVSSQVAIREFGTIQEMLERFAHAQPRFSLLVLGVFAATGTLLVGIGVFGLTAYTVARQTREIAVRVALGAGRGHVLGVVLRLGLRLVITGILIGMLASFAAGRLLAHQLWNTSPTDPATIAGAVAVIAVVAMGACYLPARRAMRVDPMRALRTE